MLRLVRPISIRSRKPAVVRMATRAPRRSSTALVPTVVPWTSRRTSRPAMPSAPSPARTAAASLRGSDGTLVTTTRAGGLVDRGQIGEGAADVDPDDEHVREMIASGKRREAEAMATSGEAIRHLWTHKTQDHPWLSDEELVIDRAEGVWVWTERGKKLMDGFAGLAVVNVGHGRREIAEAIAEQTVRLAYYPTTRQFSNRPAAELAAKLAALTPGDLDLHDVRGQRLRGQRARRCRSRGTTGWPRARAEQAQGHLARGRLPRRRPTGTFAVCGLPHMVEAVRAAAGAGLRQGGAAAPVPRPRHGHRRGAGRSAAPRELREAIVAEGPETVSAVILEPILSSGGFIIPPLGWLRAVRAHLRRARTC